jgi:hypothetical protein
MKFFLNKKILKSCYSALSNNELSLIKNNAIVDLEKSVITFSDGHRFVCRKFDNRDQNEFVPKFDKFFYNKNKMSCSFKYYIEKKYLLIAIKKLFVKKQIDNKFFNFFLKDCFLYLKRNCDDIWEEIPSYHFEKMIISDADYVFCNVNQKYLKEAVERINGERLIVEFNTEPLDPIVIREVSNLENFEVIMPVV